jgi:F-type H+-transporting ATPase subunit epsilon
MPKRFQFEILSPDGKHFEDHAEILNVRLSDGEIGIMAGHVPLIGVIDTSWLNYKRDGKSFDFAISGGILNVQKDKVIVLASSFESRDEIDIGRAKKAEERAKGLIEKAKSQSDEIDLKRAQVALKKAINRISLIERK